MESERLCYLLKELDYEVLAAGTAFAGEAVRNRILEHMAGAAKTAALQGAGYGTMTKGRISPKGKVPSASGNL